MINEPPFSTAKKLILSGDMKTLAELLVIIKKTPLAKAMGTGPQRLNRLVDNPKLFTFEDAYIIAELLGVDEKAVVDIIHAQYLLDKKAPKKRPKKK
jgi:plasmid maintenance system antidote protein VapI